MKNTKEASLILISFILQACVGYISFKPNENKYENPYIDPQRVYTATGENEYYKTNVGQCGDWIFRDHIYNWAPRSVPSTVDQLETNCGRPDTVKVQENMEIWIYNKSSHSLWSQRYVWYGVVPVILLVPIPLAVPVGRSYAEFAIENGYVISATFYDTFVKTALCGSLVLKGGHGLFLSPGCM